MQTTSPMTEPTLSALAFGQPLWAPDESDAQSPAAPQNPGQTRPRGNGAVHEADLARGEEQLGRVLGW
jgi:hypothetical protein